MIDVPVLSFIGLTGGGVDVVASLHSESYVD